jgi:hypothetical protein
MESRLIVLPQRPSLRAMGGRGRASEPINWTGWAASPKRGAEANPGSSSRDGRHEPAKAGVKSLPPRPPRKASRQTRLCPYRKPTPVGREGNSPGERVSLCQGTRQLGPVPSEEGAP